MTFLYFAYGSNMLSSRLYARCPSAKMICAARVERYALDFSKKSLDGSAKANLVEQSFSVQTPGVLFEINIEDRHTLDMFEGAGKEYDRIDDFRINVEGQTISATTYLATARHDDLVPFDWYLALVLAGAIEHRLGDEHIARICATGHQPDPVTGRTSRIAALDALVHHGHDDYMRLLGRASSLA